MMEYVGEYVNNDNGSELDWVHLLHLRLIFYTYSYASGLLISKSLQKMVKSDKSKIETVKEFLRTGSSKSPIDIFADMKIDITDKEFWLKGLDEVDDLLKEAERLADRVK
jgi:oligoendopeptidase F